MSDALTTDGFDYLLPEVENFEVDIDALIRQLVGAGTNVRVIAILSGVRRELGATALLSAIRTNRYGEDKFSQDAAAVMIAVKAAINVMDHNNALGKSKSVKLYFKLANYARGLLAGEMDIGEGTDGV